MKKLKNILELKHLTILFLVCACVDNREIESLEIDCNTVPEANTSFSQLKDLYEGEVIQIQEDLIVEGYVISSDKEGNIFGSIHIQERPFSPTEGIELHVDSRDSHLFYPVGSKVIINLKNLYLGKSKGVYSLGGVFTSFGNLSIGRLPANSLQDHLVLQCNVGEMVKPTVLELEEISEKHLNTLIELKKVEFKSEELGLSYAVPMEETKRNLVNCSNASISIVNSGYSNFQNTLLPEGNGSVIAIVHMNNKDFELIIRDTTDVHFNSERCTIPLVPVSSDEVMISELADPDNNANARFVELFNSSDNTIHLFGWKLLRYTNENIEYSSEIDLSAYSIEAGGTLVFASNAIAFNSVYGFIPNLDAGSNSPADSNGDDNLQLIDPFGKIIDTFGVVGEDGSGTNHEFEDGRAVRRSAVFKANSSYNFAEWIIYNDTGSSNTINSPQYAPQNYSPGIHH